ncbi:circadian clock-controlled protein-like [Drosophila serrata]|uniref:circadian clock-controlled protein-like n=1 Tax=Drosophila serrata TaxID=7274 RepID=UPI000A1D0873|nr:circadian clock-controlled protein-like [Drosophila serrata]
MKALPNYTSSELPSLIQKCHFSNETCLIDSFNSYIRIFARGIPHLGFRPFDKFPLPDIPVYNCSHDRPIWMSFILRNTVFKGLENATVYEVKGFDKDPTKKMIRLKYRIPRIEVDGSFDYQTKIIFFKANGTGSIKFDLQNARFTTIFKVYIEFRKEKRHLKLYSYESQLELDRMILVVDNLFADNSDLTIAINKVLNTHWLEFWNELEPNFMPTLSRMGVNRTQRFFDHFSYDDIFLKDNEQ